MKLYSSNNTNHIVDLKHAVLQSLPPDGGLYMPCEIPVLPSSFIDTIRVSTLTDIAYRICSAFIGDYIPSGALEQIVINAINFPAPLVQLDESTFVLELFHGPSLAFKDFGARFMAQLMSYFTREENQELTILVATSGDTGGAVAAGFHNTPGVRVIILYPSGMVSALQEKQLTTLGGNITALEVEGSFDDCQDLVKQAFLDKELKNRFSLSSANSINIARLIPQSFYYFEAYRQLCVAGYSEAPVFSVPSGNFGNLTAGVLAHKMGLPVHRFLAANNVNDSVYRYLLNGEYIPNKTIATISNAMDVGNPSNFSRLLDIYSKEDGGEVLENMRKVIQAYSVTDIDTREEIDRLYASFGYIIDPHGAVGSLALKEYLSKFPGKVGVVLETAHPSKFLPVVEGVLSTDLIIPERLAKLANRDKEAVLMSTKYTEFKSWLLSC